MLYLSVPYSSSDAAARSIRAHQARQAMARLMAEGRLVLCPVAMNHEAMEFLSSIKADPGGVYWRAIEAKLAAVCDELAVLRLPGWDQSRGVAREVELFESMRKPVTFLEPPEADLVAAGADAGREPELIELDE